MAFDMTDRPIQSQRGDADDTRRDRGDACRPSDAAGCTRRQPDQLLDATPAMSEDLPRDREEQPADWREPDDGDARRR